MNEAGNNAHFRAEAVPLREKLRRIRDSDHPAAPWARNVVQCLDDLKGRPDDPALLRALGKSVAIFELMMTHSMYDGLPRVDVLRALTPSEIAAIFGLGGDHGTHQ